MKMNLTLAAAFVLALSGPVWADEEVDVEVETEGVPDNVRIETERSTASPVINAHSKSGRIERRSTKNRSTDDAGDAFDAIPEAFDDAADGFDEIPEAFEDTF